LDLLSDVDVDVDMDIHLYNPPTSGIL